MDVFNFLDGQLATSGFLIKSSVITVVGYLAYEVLDAHEKETVVRWDILLWGSALALVLFFTLMDILLHFKLHVAFAGAVATVVGASGLEGMKLVRKLVKKFLNKLGG